MKFLKEAKLPIDKDFIIKQITDYNNKYYRNYNKERRKSFIYDIISDLDDKDFQDILEYFSNLDFPLTVYRGLSLKQDKDVRLENLGLHWTTDYNLFNNKYSIFKTSNYIVTAEITPEMVNWPSTINNYLYYTLRHSFYPESEITLKRNAKPKILNVEYRDYNDELTR